MPTRQYRDASGTDWEIFEVHRLNQRPNSVRPALAGGWLAFVSDHEKRRLPSYPSDWMDRADDELQELLAAAFVAVDAIPSSERSSGPISSPLGEESQRAVDRRRRPRVTPQDSAGIPGGGLPGPTSITLAAGTTAPLGGLPISQPQTVTGTLGSAGIEALVRAHARQSRQDGVAVIQAMIGIKRALAHAGEDASPETLALLRKVFVDEFYFAR